MSYNHFYVGGWQSGENGGTPITPEALNHIENGIKQTYSDCDHSKYGLGRSKRITSEMLDSTIAPGFYDISETMTICNITANYWYMTVSAYGDGASHCTQEMRPVGNDRASKLVRSYSSSVGTWDEWECENPPLLINREYRTTERYLGKVVYVKAVNFGAMPNATTKKVEFGISNITNVLSYYGIMNSGGLFPRFAPSGTGLGDIKLYVNPESNAWIETTSDYSANTATIVLKYTKD